MRNKIGILFLTVLLLAALLAGCGGDEAPAGGDSVGTGELQDGHYLIKNPVSDQGNFGMAQMEVVDGEISFFEFVEILADSGENKSEDNYPYKEGLEVVKNLNQQFNEKKNLADMDFDAVSGATSTKGAFKDIVTRLLGQAENGQTYTPQYTDGVYRAKAKEDAHGWLGEVEVVIREGQIVGLDYFELAIEDMESTRVVFDEDNKPVTASDGKDVTEPVEVKAGDRKSAENYAHLAVLDVIKGVQRLIIDNNGTENLDVDSVTGATSTRTTIIELVEEALEGAK